MYDNIPNKVEIKLTQKIVWFLLGAKWTGQVGREKFYSANLFYMGEIEGFQRNMRKQKFSWFWFAFKIFWVGGFRQGR